MIKRKHLICLTFNREEIVGGKSSPVAHSSGDLGRSRISNYLKESRGEQPSLLRGIVKQVNKTRLLSLLLLPLVMYWLVLFSLIY